MSDDDQPFLFRLFASGRPDLEWVSGISQEQKDDLIYQQNLFQQKQLISNYPDAECNIILMEGQPIGRLYIYRGKKEYRILDIILLPEYRRMGIERKLLEDILREAAEANKPVGLQVAWYNDAGSGLYEKLGFHVVRDMGVCREMNWSSNG